MRALLFRSTPAKSDAVALPVTILPVLRRMLIAPLSITFCVAALCLVCSSCAPRSGRAASSSTTQTPYLYHTISYPGETLALIALWYTGQASQWQLILQHNPGLDVLKMQRGDTIRIPRSLVVKDAPLPASAVKSPRALSSSSVVSPSEPSDSTPAAPFEESSSKQLPPVKKVDQELERPSPLSEFSQPEARPSAQASSVKPAEVVPPAVADQNATLSATATLAPKVEVLPKASPTPPKEKSREELLRELTEEY